MQRQSLWSYLKSFEIDSQQNLTQAFRAIQHAEELSEYDKKLILGGTAERIFFL